MQINLANSTPPPSSSAPPGCSRRSSRTTTHHHSPPTHHQCRHATFAKQTLQLCFAKVGGRVAAAVAAGWMGAPPPLSRPGTIFIVISQNSLGFVRKLACGSRRGSLLFQPADVVTPSAQPLIGLGDRRRGAACGGCQFDMCATEWATYSRQVFCCISAVQEGRSLPKQR